MNRPTPTVTRRIRAQRLAPCLVLLLSLGVPAALAQTATSPSGSATPNANGNQADTTTNASPNPDTPPNGGGSGLSMQDTHFMRKAAQGGATEVSLSQLALSQSENLDVKSFAQQMVTDHRKANDELMTLAQNKGVDISKSVAKGDKADLSKLSSESGMDFNQDYTRKMLKDHEEAVKLFQKEAASGKDPDVVAFANKVLPVLQAHLQHVQALAQEILK